MNVVETLYTRYSARAFQPAPVGRETVAKILSAAIHAPSWANSQPWEIFVAGGEILDRLRESYIRRLKSGAPPASELPRPQTWPPAIQQRIEELGAARFGFIGVDREDKAARQEVIAQNYHFYGAPVVIYLCLDNSLTPWSYFDLGSLAQSIMLTAAEYGLDTIPAYMFAAYPDLLRAELAIPDNLLILIGIALGYADPEAKINQFRSPRRPIAETARFSGF